MKKAWQSTEFWAAIISNIVGIAVVFGAINANEGEEIGNALKAIAGACITIATTLGYIKGRVELKKSRIESLSSYNLAFHEKDTPEETNKKRALMVEALKELDV